MTTDRTTIRLDDERKRLFDRASAIVASDEHDEPPRSEVIDAALTHLIQSRENMDDARDELDPRTIQRFNTDVLALKYRTSIDERWR
jgi:metal-responsive CopG/Arc/MetJ family transcriptional regulator